MELSKAVEVLSEASDENLESSQYAEGGEDAAGDDVEAGEEGKKVVEYRSRNAMRYDIEDSQDEGSGGEEGPDPTLAKTSLAYLNQEKRKLQREMERNAQMVEVEQQKKALGANSDQDIKPNKRFKNFNDVFSGLTRSKNVVTAHPIISCMMTYNSKSAITVTKAGDREYWVKQYSLESNQETFAEKVGAMDPKEIADPEGPYNGREPYIKLKEVQQNSTGEEFAIAYLDDGRFRLRTWKSERTKKILCMVTSQRGPLRRSDERSSISTRSLGLATTQCRSTTSLTPSLPPALSTTISCSSTCSTTRT